MKQSLLLTTAVVMLALGGTAYAGTYASGLSVSNPDSTKAFDGSFLDGTGARLWFTLNGHADTVKVWILEGGPGGNSIRSFPPILNVAAGVHNVPWDGMDNGGKVVPAGRYSFQVFTSDTGNSTSNWVQAWQNPVYLISGGGLSSRDIEVVKDPASPAFGNLIMTESTTFYGYARMIAAGASGNLLTEYSRMMFPQGTSDFDPWYVSIARNGDQYVTSSSLQSIFVFRDSVLVKTIKDTSKFKSPRGITAVGTGAPTLFFANGRYVFRMVPAGTIDTVFAVDTTSGYVRDVAVDDSGYVYASFGRTSSAYVNMVRLSPAFAILDTLALPSNVTHLNIFYGADRTTNADDKLYCRVAGNNGVFKLDFGAKTSTKLFTPSTSTSSSHSIATDLLGNIYYANPSAEWVRMYVPPSATPTKWTTKGGPISVTSATAKVLDGFEAGVGHFNQVPTYSGSTTGISASSSGKQSTVGGFNGIGSMEVNLLDDPASTNAWEVRFLSGTGAVANNDSLGPVGWIGYWMRTRTAPPGAMTAIGLDDPSDPATKRSIKRPVINDGSWHLYQWNIGDSTQWTPWVVTSGSPKIKGPKVTVDAVWFFAPDSTRPWTINFDEVSYNPAGPVGTDIGTGDVTGNGTVSALDASWILQFVVKLRPFSPQQIMTGDVNLSHNGSDVNAFDAAYVLADVVGSIPGLPFRLKLPGGLRNVDPEQGIPSVLVNIPAVRGSAGQRITVPINVHQDLAGARSAQMNLIYNPSNLKILSVSTASLTKDFAIESNIGSGTVAIAMAGGDELKTGGQIISVEAEILQSSDNIVLQLKDIMINENGVSSVTSVGTAGENVPTAYELLQNYPNPFNPSTIIEYRLPQAGPVELKVYDVAGREVVTLVSQVQEAGYYRVNWNATSNSGMKVASGVYFYQLTAGSFTQLKKMVLLK